LPFHFSLSGRGRWPQLPSRAESRGEKKRAPHSREETLVVAVHKSFATMASRVYWSRAFPFFSQCMKPRAGRAGPKGFQPGYPGTALYPCPAIFFITGGADEYFRKHGRTGTLAPGQEKRNQVRENPVPSRGCNWSVRETCRQSVDVKALLHGLRLAFFAWRIVVGCQRVAGTAPQKKTRTNGIARNLPCLSISKKILASWADPITAATGPKTWQKRLIRPKSPKSS